MVTHRFFSIVKEYLSVIRYACGLLRLCTSTVDTRGSLGGVTTHETEQLLGQYLTTRSNGMLTPVYRVGEHLHHARGEYVLLRDQQGHHRRR